MRYLIFFLVFITFFSCDDGNFDVLQFNFENKVNTCGNYVLYRTNTEKTEVLILSLAEADIVQEVGTKTILITEENVKYRIFDESLSTDYFCAVVPPTTPIVVKEWKAVPGVNNTITIDTTEIIEEIEDIDTIIGYEHILTFTNLILENEGVQEKYVSYLFGSFETDLPSD